MKRLKYAILIIITVLVVGCKSSCALQGVAGRSAVCYQGVVSE